MERVNRGLLVSGLAENMLEDLNLGVGGEESLMSLREMAKIWECSDVESNTVRAAGLEAAAIDDDGTTFSVAKFLKKCAECILVGSELKETITKNVNENENEIVERLNQAATAEAESLARFAIRAISNDIYEGNYGSINENELAQLLMKGSASCFLTKGEAFLITSNFMNNDKNKLNENLVYDLLVGSWGEQLRRSSAWLWVSSGKPKVSEWRNIPEPYFLTHTNVIFSGTPTSAPQI
tara:strand:- start:221 stop:934 length:714 start_codon:yes stop_codon:yes gene_type:complete